MFVVDKEAKIRSLFVMPSAKTSGERDGALHKIACCSISIQGGPQGWTWMGWFITMYPKNLHIFIYPMKGKHVFRINRSLHLKLLKHGPFLTNYGFLLYSEFSQGHRNCKIQPCSCI